MVMIKNDFLSSQVKQRESWVKRNPSTTIHLHHLHVSPITVEHEHLLNKGLIWRTATNFFYLLQVIYQENRWPKNASCVPTSKVYNSSMEGAIQNNTLLIWLKYVKMQEAKETNWSGSLFEAWKEMLSSDISIWSQKCFILVPS